MLTIIDVSNWNRGKVDLSNLSKIGVDGAIMKATEGKTFKDKSLDYFYDELHGKKDGKPDKQKLYGFYHYARPDNGNTAEEEAENFLKYVGHHKGHCIYALDWEGKALKYQIDWAVKWLDYVYEKTGVKPLFYCQASYTDMIKKIIDKDYGLWVAHYGTSKPYIGVYPFYAMWQYTSSKLDYNRFNGNKEVWKKYCEVRK